MKAIVIGRHGGPEVLQVAELATPEPAPGEVLVKNHAIGVNFVDTQHRAGTPYPINLPLIPGIEAAGVVTQVGSKAHTVRIGDRVAYAGYMGGNYADYTVVSEEKLVHIPDNVSFELTAAGLMQAMTAHCLVYSAYAVNAGDVVLIQAGAGGVGLQLIQLAKRRGATVITTVSSAAKADLVRSFGADHAIIYTEDDFESETMRITHGEGVNVVYDAVGRTTFDKGINLLRTRGVMVVYGLSSGTVPPFDINRLSGITGGGNRGSRFLTWATLSDYTTQREDLRWRAGDVLGWLGDGSLKVHVDCTLPLHEAAEAHRRLESRQSVGKILLIP